MNRKEYDFIHSRKWPEVSLVIPVLNEEQNLRLMLAQIAPIFSEIIVVDGGSTDGSVRAVREILPHAKVISGGEKGKGDAIRAGLARATGDVLIQVDADGSMNPDEIPQFVAAIESGYDLAKGSRNLPGGGSSDLTLTRRIGNRFFARLVNLLFRTKYTDLCYGFIAYSRRAADIIDIKSDGFNIEAEIAMQAKVLGLRVKEIPSFERKRAYGISKLHFMRDGGHILITILKYAVRHTGWRQKKERTLADRRPAGTESHPATSQRRQGIVHLRGDRSHLPDRLHEE
jgi:glycosyltransferase involved in cell wall biosynthesis